MDARASNLHLVSLPGGAPDLDRDAHDQAFTDADLDAARELAECHRMLAAELEPHSQLRGLVLRCASHWSRLGAIPRNGLATAEPHERA